MSARLVTVREKRQCSLDESCHACEKWTSHMHVDTLTLRQCTCGLSRKKECETYLLPHMEMRGSFVEIQGSFARYRALVGGKSARSQSYVGYGIDAFMSYSVRADVPSKRERVCDMTHPGCVSRVMSHM
mmetsp:Transcript_40245/g.64894  ORF Transcript_40245/g.64894 Transcript_40245/m.64894 type:complete len:129 (+) Transcript_40245:75-461(+)